MEGYKFNLLAQMGAKIELAQARRFPSSQDVSASKVSKKTGQYARWED